MIIDNQSTVDTMLTTLNEMTTYQQCIEHVLPKLDTFLNVNSRNIMNGFFHLR